MKNILFAVVFSLAFILQVSAQQLDLRLIRRDFNKGVKDQELCERYLSVLEAQADNPLERAYAAAFHMFMAKHTANPIKKMRYFKQGRDRLEKELALEPENVEIRFIRLSIQYHIPKYLGYHDEIQEDKQFLLNNLYKIKDLQTKKLLFDYLKGANMYSDKELALLAR